MARLGGVEGRSDLRPGPARIGGAHDRHVRPHAFEPGGLPDQQCRGAGIDRGGGKAGAILLGAGQAGEQRAGADLVRIGAQRHDRRIEPFGIVQGGAMGIDRVHQLS
jgi:hypothetical protein